MFLFNHLCELGNLWSSKRLQVCFLSKTLIYFKQVIIITTPVHLCKVQSIFGACCLLPRLIIGYFCHVLQSKVN